MGRFCVLLIGFVLFFAGISSAQNRVSGTLTDAVSGETLPAATIQIKDTYRGTITSNEGRFDIEVSEFPVTLIFRYIGYDTLEKTFESPVSETDISLQPVSIELEEIVFTGQDPAMHIMERVILRKQLWRENLESWKAEAYTRQNLSNDEGIVSITESYSTTWWHRDKGFREVVTDKRQTNNILPNQNFAGASYLPNFYDDEIRIAGFRVIGVTHPDAFRYYNFEIVGRRQIDNDIVYDIKVIPKTRLQPSFEGTISVLGSEYALLEVNLVPGNTIFFPPPINKVDLEYRQQFSNYGGDFWLPADIRIAGTIDIGMVGFRIPEIIFNQSASITGYEINIPVPDSLYERRQMLQTDTTAVKQNQLFETRSEAIPLTLEEREAYDTIDSTKTVQDAFKPTGFLADLAGAGESSTREPGFWNNLSWSPDVHYNRVDALYLGFRPSYRVNQRLTLRGVLGYNSGLEQLGYGGGLTYRLGENRRFYTGTDYEYNSIERIRSGNFNRMLASTSALYGNSDFFDHYLSERVRVFAGYRFRWNSLQPQLAFHHERHQSLSKTTNYSLPGGFIQRENPAIDEGTLNSIGLILRAGEQVPPFGIIGSTGFQLRLEHSNPDIITSDFDFTRAQLTADFRINTFLQRRFLPNALDIRVQAFTSTGTLPVQRFGGFDGTASLFSPYGTFKSLPNRQLEGEHGVSVFWEHNFRTVPFELLGIQALVRRSVGVIVHGAHGITWIDDDRLVNLGFIPSYEDRWRHETGVSINNIFGVFRFDTTFRIDRPAFYFGISAARFF